MNVHDALSTSATSLLVRTWLLLPLSLRSALDAEMTTGRIQIETLLTLIDTAAHDAMNEYEQFSGSVPLVGAIEPHPLDTAGPVPAVLILKKTIRLLEGACDQLVSTLAPPSHTVVNVSAICAGIMTLQEEVTYDTSSEISSSTMGMSARGARVQRGRRFRKISGWSVF